MFLGDVVHIKIFSQPMIILNSLQAARDLLDKKSSIYSDRPRFVLMAEMCVTWFIAQLLKINHRLFIQDGLGKCLDSPTIVCANHFSSSWFIHIIVVPSGPRFRKHRRFINQIFNQRAISAFRPLQEREVLTLLDNMLRAPESFVDHFRQCVLSSKPVGCKLKARARFSAATILEIAYGHNVKSVDDHFVQLGQYFHWKCYETWLYVYHISWTSRHSYCDCWNACCNSGRFLPIDKVLYVFSALLNKCSWNGP